MFVRSNVLNVLFGTCVRNNCSKQLVRNKDKEHTMGQMTRHRTQDIDRTRKGHGTCRRDHAHGPYIMGTGPGPAPKGAQAMGQAPHAFWGRAPGRGHDVSPTGMICVPSACPMPLDVLCLVACPMPCGISFALVPDKTFRASVPNNCSEHHVNMSRTNIPNIVPNEIGSNNARAWDAWARE